MVKKKQNGIVEADSVQKYYEDDWTKNKGRACASFLRRCIEREYRQNIWNLWKFAGYKWKIRVDRKNIKRVKKKYPF